MASCACAALVGAGAVGVSGIRLEEAHAKRGRWSMRSNTRSWGGGLGWAGGAWERLAPLAHRHLGVSVATLTAVPGRVDSLGAIGPIALANGVVYAAWWVAPTGFMARHFMHAPLRGPHWALLLAAFSHRSLMHLGVNMWALHSFGAPLQERWGRHKFAAAYVTACAASSAGVSVLAAVAPAALAVPGLGASGGVMALVTAACLLEPDARVGVPFAPPQFSLPAGDALKLIVGVDAMGLCAALLGIPSPLGHAAHLGGQAFGCWLVVGGGLRGLDEALHRARSVWRNSK